MMEVDKIAGEKIYIVQVKGDDMLLPYTFRTSVPVLLSAHSAQGMARIARPHPPSPINTDAIDVTPDSLFRPVPSLTLRDRP